MLFTYAYFYQAGDWGQNVRFNLVRAILQKHTLTIDAYHANSGDKAGFRGHFYLDKPPGTSFTALPFVAATNGVLRVVGIDPESNRGVVAGSYVASLTASSVPALLAALAVWWVALAFGASMGGALFAAGVFALGSPMFTYATVLWSYGLAGGGLIAAFAAAVALRHVGSTRRDFGLGAMVGACAGWATVSELACAPAAILLTVLVGLHVGKGRRLRVAAGLALGALATGGIWMSYNLAAFGNLLSVGYDHIDEGQFSLQASGGAIFGIVGPRLTVLWQILFGHEYGLFILAPVLLAAPVGLGMLVRAPADRKAGIIAVMIVGWFVFLNSSLVFWSGGGNYGPRHIAPALPFLCLGLAPVWTWATRPVKLALGAVALVGVVFAFVTVATAAVPEEDDILGPVPQAMDHFVRGELSINVNAYYYEEEVWVWPRTVEQQAALTRNAWNLGELVGLRGLPSLLPLLLAWIAGIVTWRRWSKQAPAAVV